MGKAMVFGEDLAAGDTIVFSSLGHPTADVITKIAETRGYWWIEFQDHRPKKFTRRTTFERLPGRRAKSQRS